LTSNDRCSFFNKIEVDYQIHMN